MRGTVPRPERRRGGGVGIPSAAENGAMAGFLGGGMGRVWNLHAVEMQI
jgi:hypothetical protein